MATAAALVGIDLPPEAGPDSYNILPALCGEKLSRPIREAMIVSSTNAARRAIRQGPWKLILPGRELYNLAQDPAETINVFAGNPDLVAQLTRLFERYEREGRAAINGFRLQDTSNSLNFRPTS